MTALTDFLRHSINGLQLGSIYALVALGYTMVYGIVKLINFAHGDFIMVGAYLCLFTVPFFVSLGLPGWLCVFAAVAGGAALGVFTERVAYKPLRGSPRISVLITAIGVSLLLQNLVMLFFSPNPRPFPALLGTGSVSLGALSIGTPAVVTIVLSVFLMVALQLFVQRTKLGRAMRAVSEDMATAMLMGVNVNNTISLTFGIGAGLAAVASLMYCAAYPLVEPTMGSMLGLKAFIAAVLGGIGSIPGAMLGGLLLGFAESMTKAYVSSKLSDALVFGILIVILAVRPTGILGKNIGEKV